jgi:hypothetical protein
MSFIDSAAEVLDRTEGSLSALIADALKAKAYREIGTIAAMIEAVAAIGSGRSREGKRALEVSVGAGTLAASEPAKASEPSWMRPKA